MATIAPFNQDNEDEMQQPGENAGGGGEVLSSTSGGGEPGAAGGTYSAPRQPQSSTPNISQYLAANQGAGQQLAGGITSNIQNQASQIGQNVNKAQSTLEQQYQPLNKQLGSEGQQNIQSAFQDPAALLDAYNASKTQSTSSPLSGDQQSQLDQYNQFQRLNTGGYAGDINKYGVSGSQLQNNLQGQYQNLAQQTGSANTESGRFNLLRNTIGQPGYNQGQQALDALFLQAQPGVANQLKQNLGQIGTQTQQQVQGLGTDTQSKLAALQGLSAQDQELIKNKFTGGLNEIGTNVKGEYANAAATVPGYQESLRQGVLNNTIRPDQLAALGYNSEKSGPLHTWGLSGQDILNAGQFTANPLLAGESGGYAQTANPEEFARYNALNQLAGGPSGLQSNIFGSATSAGGYNPVSFNQQALQGTIDARKNQIMGADYQAALGRVGGNANIDPVMAAIRNRNLNPEDAKALIDTFGQSILSQQSIDFSNPGVIDQIIGGAALGPVNNLAQLAGLNMTGGGGFRSRRYSPGEIYGAVMPYFNPVMDYYNQSYRPASQTVLAPNSPEEKPLPTNKDGQIDWGAIPAPTGSAGKYQ